MPHWKFTVLRSNPDYMQVERKTDNRVCPHPHTLAASEQLNLSRVPLGSIPQTRACATMPGCLCLFCLLLYNSCDQITDRNNHKKDLFRQNVQSILAGTSVSGFVVKQTIMATRSRGQGLSSWPTENRKEGAEDLV